MTCVSTSEANLAVERVVRCEDGTLLTYSIVGQVGPTLVCVNAHGQDVVVFSKIAQKLAQRFRVIFWRPRGTYESDGPEGHILDQVQDLDRIIQDAGGAPCALLSWCSGAKVALDYSLRRGSRSPVILANGSFVSLPGFEHLETEFERSLHELCKTVVRAPKLASTMMKALTTLLSSTGLTNTAAVRDAALSAMIAEPFSSIESTVRYARQYVDYHAHDIGPTLRALSAPVLVLAGERDHICSPALAHGVASHMSHAVFEQLPKASHYALYETADAALAKIEPFLRATLPNRGATSNTETSR